MKVLRNCAMAIRLTFQYAPWNALFYLLVCVMPGLFGGLRVILVQRLVDGGVDYAQGREGMEPMALAGIWLVTLLFFWFALDRVREYEDKVLEGRLIRRMAPDIMEKLNRLEYVAFESEAGQDVLQRVSGEPWQGIKSCFTGSLRTIHGVLSIFFMLGVYAAISLWIGAGIFLVAIPMLALNFAATKRLQRIFRDTTLEARRIEDLKQLLQNRNAMYEARVFASQGLISEKWEEASSGVEEEIKKEGSRILALEGSGKLLNIAYFIFITVTMSYSFVQGSTTIGQFVAVIGSLSAITGQLFAASWSVTDTFRNAMNLEYYREFLALPERGKPHDAETLAHGDIAFDNVSFAYPGTEREVLKNVTFRIKAGERVAFVGENGAGKSTIVKLLCGLYQPDSGQVLIGGVRVQELSEEQRRRMLSVVFQDFQGYELTLRENVALGDISGMKEDGRILEALRQAGGEALYLEEEKGLERNLGHLEEDGTDLSKGQWQRVAIARAFMADAAFCVLDEPVAALDPVAESRMYANFSRIFRKNGTIMISHRLASAKMADRIMVLDGGRIVQNGSHSQLMEKEGLYRTMYLAQSSWYEEKGKGEEPAEEMSLETYGRMKQERIKDKAEEPADGDGASLKACERKKRDRSNSKVDEPTDGASLEACERMKQDESTSKAEEPTDGVSLKAHEREAQENGKSDGLKLGIDCFSRCIRDMLRFMPILFWGKFAASIVEGVLQVWHPVLIAEIFRLAAELDAAVLPLFSQKILCLCLCISFPALCTIMLRAVGLYGDSRKEKYYGWNMYGHAQGIPLKALEDKEVLDSFRKADAAYAEHLAASRMFSYLLMDVESVLVCVSTLLVVSRFSVWLLPCAVLGFVPHLLLEVISERRRTKVYRGQSAQRRRLRYLWKLFCTKEPVKEMRTMGFQKYLKERWVDTNMEVLEEVKKVELRAARLSGAGVMAKNICYVANVAVALLLMVKGELAVGEFAACLTAFGLLQDNLLMLDTYVISFLHSYHHVQEYYDFFQVETEKHAGESYRPFQRDITLQDVHFRYPGADGDALKGVSLQIKKGEHVVIVGENGSGKTTLSKLLTGVYLADSGHVCYDGQDVGRLDRRGLYKDISLVGQDFYHYHFSLRENICVSDFRRRADEAHIQEVVESAGLEELVQGIGGLDVQLGREFGGRELSGGEWQKVAVARGIFKDSELIVLDEPTSALDPLVEYRILTGFLRLIQGKTSVIISHRVGICRHADKIVVMKDGRVVECGTHQELKSAGGEYSRIWGEQAKWIRQEP